MNLIYGAIPQLKQMAVADYTPSGALEVFDKIAAGEKQHGRIVSIAAVKTSLDVTGWDTLDVIGWQALITSADVHVLGPVTGELPDPSESTSPGDGHQEEISDGETYDIPFHFYNPDDNMALANKLNKQSAEGTWSVMIVFYDMTGYIWTSKGVQLVPVKYRLRASSQGLEISNNRKMMGNVKFRVTELQKVIKDLPAAIFKKN